MTFFLDLWHDLREKRLWPVAVGLLAAAIAIPVVMLKPAGDPAPPPAIASDSAAGETLPAVSVDAGPVHGSKLETFSTRNPFKSLADLEKEETPTDGSTGSDGTAAAGSAGSGDSGSALGGGSTGSTGSTPGGSSGGSPTAPTTPADPDDEPLQWYRYAVDVKFGEPDAQKTLKRVPRLASLPDDETPAVVFMGVSDGGDRAVFYVADPSLTADGEGDCADDDNCRVVTLGLSEGSDEQTFTSSDGTVQYDLQLLRIRRESMDEPQAKQAAEPVEDDGVEKLGVGATAKAIVTDQEQFLPLLLAGPDVALGTE